MLRPVASVSELKNSSKCRPYARGQPINPSQLVCCSCGATESWSHTWWQCSGAAVQPQCSQPSSGHWLTGKQGSGSGHSREKTHSTLPWCGCGCGGSSWSPVPSSCLLFWLSLHISVVLSRDCSLWSDPTAPLLSHSVRGFSLPSALVDKPFGNMKCENIISICAVCNVRCTGCRV